ncbi:MAG: TonB-dependent receptor [Burkholderiales bacterium]|jgi:iron complex outermembrane receptor protein|nr:TonB-dependent receptor [Burkholderiales bacterium]
MSRCRRTAIALLACTAAAARAQQPPAPVPDEFEAPGVVVTANPLGSALLDMVQPADVLAGPRLQYRMAPTLGEMLGSQVGVNQSWFGPGASRPVIRGLDGERVRLLTNGVGIVDASGASPDHAVGYEPLLAERVEIVRGPATLLYGASAIGGVVNVIDNRIPSAAPEGGFGGSVGLRYGGAGDERSGVVKLDGGTDRFALHVDAFKRNTSDLRIPGFARSERLRAQSPLPAGEDEASGRQPNSASDTEGFGAGGSVLFEKGFVGVSASEMRSTYGTVAEKDVTIDMIKQRYDIAGEFSALGGFIDGVKFRTGYTNYRHTEFEGPDPGTRFGNDGVDGRIDIRHARVGRFEGAFGFQGADTKFSAVGDEKFVPVVRTRVASAFLYEETALGTARLSAGGRVDGTEVGSEDDPTFGPGRARSFTAASGSAGALVPFGESGFAVAANVSYNERAPNYVELFANGPHVATGVFEIGNPDQKLERSTAFDVALRKRTGFVTGSAGVFAHRFSNFIGLFPNGITNIRDPLDPDDDLPEAVFRGVKANFRGVEANARVHAIEDAERTLHFDLGVDWTRATDATTGLPLPRIAPLRVLGAVLYRVDRASFRVDVTRAESQGRVTANELPTDRYTLVNAAASYALPRTALGQLSVFLKVFNLTDDEVRLHTSTLKDLSPLGGRTVMVGIDGAF